MQLIVPSPWTKMIFSECRQCLIRSGICCFSSRFLRFCLFLPLFKSVCARWMWQAALSSDVVIIKEEICKGSHVSSQGETKGSKNNNCSQLASSHHVKCLTVTHTFHNPQLCEEGEDSSWKHNHWLLSSTNPRHVSFCHNLHIYRKVWFPARIYDMGPPHSQINLVYKTHAWS